MTESIKTNEIEEIFLKTNKKKQVQNILDKESETKNDKLSHLKHTFIEWSLLTKFDCFSKIFEYEHNLKAKLFWLLVFLAMIFLTFWLIVLNILDFLKHQIVTKTERLYENPTLFPAVTICDNFAFASNQGQALMTNISQTYNVTDEFVKEYLTRMEAANPSFNDANRKKLALFDLTSFLKCEYKAIEFNCTKYFRWFFSFEYGNCYQFNTGFNFTNNEIELLNASRSGQDFALELKIDTNYTSDAQMGLVVFIHNSSFDPLPTDAIYVEQGKLTFIGIKRTFISNYPSPYSECVDLTSYKSYLYNYLISLGRTYRQEDCFNLCIQQSILEACGCFFTAFSNLNTNLRACLNITDYTCVDSQVSSFNIEECSKTSCPLQCKYEEFDYSLSSLTNPSSDTYLNLNIYYPSLEYTQITESPKTSPYDLLAQLGGALGMFVSLSVFTLVEILEITFLMVYHFLFHCKKNN